MLRGRFLQESSVPRDAQNDALCEQCGVAIKTAINLQTDLRGRVRDEFPKDENGKPLLPRMPAALQRIVKERRATAAQATTARNENPTRVNGDLLVQRAVDGVRDGIERVQVPQLQHFLAFLIPLRANDLTPAHVRASTDRRASAEPHVWAETTKSGVPVVGSLLNLWPSKDNPNLPPPLPYGTVCTCDPKDYELIQRGLQCVHDNKDLPCTRTMKEYRDNVPSGPETDAGEWGRGMDHGIKKQMMKRLKLTEALVEPTGTWAEQAAIFNKSQGRHFAACMMEQGRFVTEPNLLSAVAFTRALGHRPMAEADHNYRILRCENVTTLKNVILRKITAEDPLFGPNDLSDGIAGGVYLTSAPAQDEETP